MQNVLLIEVSTEAQRLVAEILDRFTVLTATSFEAAEKEIKSRPIDLILLDTDLPDGDGFKFCANLKSWPSTKDIPVVFLTLRNDSSDKVIGFSLGAEDYITKPFEPNEFKARIEARLKKIAAQKTKENHFVKGELSFNVSCQRVTFRKNNGEERLDLTPFEFKILLYFARHENHVLSRAKLMNALWGSDIYVLDRTVDGHISSLRKKIKESSFTIRAVYGEGYAFSRKERQGDREIHRAPSRQATRPESL